MNTDIQNTPVDTQPPTDLQAAAVDPDALPEGCVFMFRDGERAMVNVASGSVAVMADLGWAQAPTEPAPAAKQKAGK